MDQNRFDKLAVALAESESSRRSVLERLAGGGFAAALAKLGIGGFNVEDAEAKSCQKKCKKKNSNKSRKKCKKRCKKSGGGGGGGGGGGNSSGAGVQINVGTGGIGASCTASQQCASGFCELGLGICATCLTTCGQQCCVVGAFCNQNRHICVFPDR